MSDEPEIQKGSGDPDPEEAHDMNPAGHSAIFPLDYHSDSIQKISEKMETHAHHLHHAPGKKIFHYFYEFLMLFLAVFCGFLAENFREHYVERERAEQYMASFYQDLRADTAKLSADIAWDQDKLATLNGMTNCYDTLRKNWMSTRCLWALVTKSMANRRFILTDRTLKQLANAGGFRLLKKEDADSITSYESQYNTIDDFQATIFQQAQDNVRNTFNEMVDFSANGKMFTAIDNADSLKIENTIPLLYAKDQALMNKYFNQLYLYARVTRTHVSQMEKLKVRAMGLMEYFKTEHKFE